MDQAEQMLGFLGLSAWLTRTVSSLPYGSVRIVELARALSMRPKLLLLDEPTAGMSATESKRLEEWLGGVRRILDLTIVVVAHDLRLVRSMSTIVFAMEAGRVFAQGTPDEVAENPRVRQSFIALGTRR